MRIAALLMLAASMCTPPASKPSPPAPPVTTAPTPAGDAGLDSISLAICVANFQQLNPDLTPAQVQDVFCSTPEDIAPWVRKPIQPAH